VNQMHLAPDNIMIQFYKIQNIYKSGDCYQFHAVRYSLCDDTECRCVSVPSIQEHAEAPNSLGKLQSHPTGPAALYYTPGHKERT
jgi:hypothetical protein